MADIKGTDGKPDDVKPADTNPVEAKPVESKPLETKPSGTKSGPVKPPVLDLKARDTTPIPPKPDVKLEDKPRPSPDNKPAFKSDSKPTARPATPPRVDTAKSSSFAFGAALAGGVLGLAAAYGLASLGYWPAPAQVTPAADPRLAQFASAIPELETVTQTTQSELATLNQRVATLESGAPDTETAAAAPAAKIGRAHV